MTTPEQFAGDIIKSLEALETASGTRAGTVFDDFLTASLLILERLPDHLENVTTTGRLAAPTPDEAETFQRMHERYSRIRDLDPRDYFAPAFNALLESTACGYLDVLGAVYMRYGYPGEGQIFTSWNVAEMMARMTIGDAEQLHFHVKEAITQSPAARAALMAGLAVEDPDEVRAWFLEEGLPPALPHYEPIRVCHPCVGSGAKLLAAASVFPQWAVHHGLVQFYGQDVDPTCVVMAKVNLMLYGLNGERVRYALALSDAELGALPEPWAEMYAEAKRAKEDGDDGRVREIAEAVREGKRAQFERVPLPL